MATAATTGLQRCCSRTASVPPMPRRSPRRGSSDGHRHQPHDDGQLAARERDARAGGQRDDRGDEQDEHRRGHLREDERSRVASGAGAGSSVLNVTGTSSDADTVVGFDCAARAAAARRARGRRSGAARTTSACCAAAHADAVEAHVRDALVAGAVAVVVLDHAARELDVEHRELGLVGAEAPELACRRRPRRSRSCSRRRARRGRRGRTWRGRRAPYASPSWR